MKYAYERSAILQTAAIVDLGDAEVAAVVDDELHRRPGVLRIGDRATEQVDRKTAAVHGDDFHAVAEDSLHNRGW